MKMNVQVLVSISVKFKRQEETEYRTFSFPDIPSMMECQNILIQCIVTGNKIMELNHPLMNCKIEAYTVNFELLNEKEENDEITRTKSKKIVSI